MTSLPPHHLTIPIPPTYADPTALRHEIDAATAPLPHFHWRLRNEPASVTLARRLTAAALTHWRVTAPADALLVVSELVGNGVLHGAGDVTLRLHRDADLLRIAVTDTGSGTPAPRYPDPHETNGRGLVIVDELTAGRWGVHHLTGGTTVWAVLPTALPRQAARPHPPHPAAPRHSGDC
ncbi:ATP-binding protein [Allostreptomyces psammosilenae]|uniref:Signal transduction histidine kinase n=1 Tax=Allostreptomyces psammosilenae TaxID=1892865 RepID=A0A852ZLV5_9ACTN|nr:ATP-binding protein [Allostreptomyces psammosilenae]NYI03379.1 signal transduction histidine kinase [Allostreptomyces psammosilenae]